MTPQTRYARNGDVSIAYQVMGDGLVDLVFVGGYISHLEHQWEEPGLARFFERLASFTRLIIIDRRGSGLSDPTPPDASMEGEVGDLDAVLDASGSRRAALLAYTAGGPLAVKYAAERPDRALALILYGCNARSTFADDYDWAHTEEQRDEQSADQLEHWGEGLTLDLVAPSCAGDARMRAWMGRLERLSSSPGTIAATFSRMGGVDVRESLRLISAPTLVLHRTGDRFIDVRHARFAAAQIAGARLVELEGTDSMPTAGDTDAILDEIEEFLTEGRAPRAPERALRTVLFTDIVDGTAQAAALGDRAWRDRLGAHDAAVRRALERFAGSEIKTTGDGFLVVFEGSPSRGVRCAQAILQSVGELGLDVRAGLHHGECELIGADVGGLAVHVAARVAALARGGEVLVSSTVRESVLGSGLEFAPRGEHELKGVPGRWAVFSLT